MTRSIAFLSPALLALALLAPAVAPAADRDADGVVDTADNCLWVANPDQYDSDGDGFGNPCDADLTNDGVVGLPDWSRFAAAFGSSDPDADFTGDGLVGLPDLPIFHAAFGKPVGPGAIPETVASYHCTTSHSCTVPVLPGISLSVTAAQIGERGDGSLQVTGDVAIPTPAGDVVLGDADLRVVPNVSLTGTSIVPDYDVGSLAGGPGVLSFDRVDVRTSPGAALDVEIPLHDDVHYVVFESGGIVETWLGDVRVVAPSSGWKLILDPTDPFLYTAGEAVVPALVGGLQFIESASGFGMSLEGRVPFRIDTLDAITEVMPTLLGDHVAYLSGSLDPFPISFEGFAVTDVDPDGDGDPVFGDAPSTGSDYRFGLDGTVSFEVGLVIPGFTLELQRLSGSVVTSHTGVRSGHPKTRTWVAGRLPRVDELNGISRNLMSLPEGEHAFVTLWSSDPSENFLRMASQDPVVVDTVRMGAGHGVDVELSTVSSSILQLDSTALTLTGESFSESLHPDVRFTASQQVSLRWNWEDETGFEYRVDSESELGGVALRAYGVRLTDSVFQHWGRYETPNWAYELSGEYGPDGAWLEGTVEVPLPYRYPAVDRVADVAGRIAAQDQVVAALESDYQLELATLRDLEAQTADALAALATARDALRVAQRALEDAQDALADHNAYDCGTCAWYDAACWTAVGICEAWKVAARPAYEEAVDWAQAGVDTAQAAVTRAAALVTDLQILVVNARYAVDLALAAADDARAALVVLRDEREALPLADGTIDAVVSLRLTRDGLTGTVSGTFEGVDFGTGRVESDAAGARACFVVPQTGEELCTAL